VRQMGDSASGFNVAADSYDRYMGVWSRPLGAALAAAAGVKPGDRVLDVGCGTGALTQALVARAGPAAVSAVDPSETLVAACRAAAPGADVRRASAEQLPFPDDTFDATVSQLVVNFMSDAPAGVREMRRVTRPGGVVASCTWDYREGMAMLCAFWDAAVSVDPSAPHEGSEMRYCSPGELESLWLDAGIGEPISGSLTVTHVYDGFDDLWSRFELGVGPGGAYFLSLDADRRARVREQCFRLLGSPEGEVELTARAWVVRGIA
jgi:SAM-dependent methyltransferase